MKPKQEFVEIPAGVVEIDGVGLVEVASFKLSNLCVTAGEFAEFIKVTGRDFDMSNQQEFNKPIVLVSWGDAKAYAEWKGCRLPSEAEWQWAAQGGELKQIWAGTSDQTKLGEFAWFGESERNKPHRVGKKSPNVFGLFDMSGNVWEWCDNLYSKNGSDRVLRGGAFNGDVRRVRCASRFRGSPHYWLRYFGFRLVVRP